MDRARKGQGPSFIEVVCYRWKEHVGPNTDFHLGHRTKEELESWMAKDPVKLFGEMAEKQKLLSRAEQEKIRAKVEKQIEEAVAFAKASPFPEPAAMFEDL